MIHRRFGGSTAARTIACPGWHQESDGIPRSTSVYAQRGTALHSIMEELILEDEPNTQQYAGMVVEGISITSEMVRDKIEPAFAAFRILCRDFVITELEPEVECSYAKEIGGYSDLIMRGGDTVLVVDWKFGDGIQVSAHDSPQAKFYGMAARKNSSASDLFEGATRFVAAIIQPNDREPHLRVWEADISVLDTFEKQYLRSVKEANSKHPPMATGDHCAFCPAAPLCPQKTGQALSAMRMEPEDLSSLIESLDMVKELKTWITAVERAGFEQLNAGCEVSGWKLVQKRAISKWKDEAEVLREFRRRLGGIKRMTKAGLLTPAQMIKLGKSRGVDIDIEDFIVKTSSGTTMAPEDDKRPAVLAGAAISEALKGLTK